MAIFHQNCLHNYVLDLDDIIYDEMFISLIKDIPKYYDDCAFFFSFHTSFIDQNTNRLFLSRNELDNPHKKKFWKVYNKHFACELIFEDLIC